MIRLSQRLDHKTGASQAKDGTIRITYTLEWTGKEGAWLFKVIEPVFITFRKSNGDREGELVRERIVIPDEFAKKKKQSFTSKISVKALNGAVKVDIEFGKSGLVTPAVALPDPEVTPKQSEKKSEKRKIGGRGSFPVSQAID